MLSVLKFHCTSIRTSYRVVRVLYLLLSCFHALGGVIDSRSKVMLKVKRSVESSFNPTTFSVAPSFLATVQLPSLHVSPWERKGMRIVHMGMEYQLNIGWTLWP